MSWLFGPLDPRPPHSYVLMFWNPFARTEVAWNPWVVVAYSLLAVANIIAASLAVWLIVRARAPEGSASFALALATSSAGFAVLLFVQPQTGRPDFGSGDGPAFSAVLARLASTALIGGSMYAFARTFFSFPSARPIEDFIAYGANPSPGRIEVYFERRRAALLRWAAQGSFAAGIAVFGLAMVAPHIASDIAFSTRTVHVLSLFGSWSQTLARLTFAIALCTTAWLFVTALVVQYRLGDDRTRNILQSLYLAFIAACIVFAVPTLLRALAWYGGWFGTERVLAQLASVIAFPAAALCFVAGIALMVLKGGAFDAGLYVSRTLTVSVCGLTLTIAFVVVEVFVQDIVLKGMGIPGQTGAIASALAVTFAFNPVRRWIEQKIDRLLGR